MKVQEYLNLTDLQLLRSIQDTLRMINAHDVPNKTRLHDMKVIVYAMIDELEPQIKVEG